ncbi:hypothetical protein AAMO2058_001663500 [Amorphochlora amoebiformis]
MYECDYRIQCQECAPETRQGCEDYIITRLIFHSVGIPAVAFILFHTRNVKLAYRFFVKMALLDFVIKFIYDIVFLSAETETPIPVRLFIHELFFLPFKLGMLHVFLSNLMASTLASQALKIIIGSVLFSKCFIFAFALDLDVSIESLVGAFLSVTLALACDRFLRLRIRQMSALLKRVKRTKKFKLQGRGRKRRKVPHSSHNPGSSLRAPSLRATSKVFTRSQRKIHLHAALSRNLPVSPSNVSQSNLFAHEMPTPVSPSIGRYESNIHSPRIGAPSTTTNRGGTFGVNDSQFRTRSGSDSKNTHEEGGRPIDAATLDAIERSSTDVVIASPGFRVSQDDSRSRDSYFTSNLSNHVTHISSNTVGNGKNVDLGLKSLNSNGFNNPNPQANGSSDENQQNASNITVVGEAKEYKYTKLMREATKLISFAKFCRWTFILGLSVEATLQATSGFGIFTNSFSSPALLFCRNLSNFFVQIVIALWTLKLRGTNHTPNGSSSSQSSQQPSTIIMAERKRIGHSKTSTLDFT